MGNKSNVLENTIERLEERSAEITNLAMLAGPSCLSYPEKVDASRLIMFNSHYIQRVVLNHSEFPKVFGNFENIVGKNSSYNVKAKSTLDVIKIVHKYPDIKDSLDTQQAFIFVYDRENEYYDVITRNDIVNLTEKYGFQYDNSELNKYEEGDTIKKGAPLYQPTSFDEYGNYGFGMNVKAMYLSNDETIEDAILVSESFAKMMESTEVERVKVSINDNDILVNIFGDDEHYKAFPDIGEHTKNKILCAKRRLNKRRILFDLKQSNMRRVLGSDILKYIDGEVVDIDIFCNGKLEDIPKAEFNEQLLHYIDMSNRCYKELKDFTDELIDSGAKCSQNLRSLNQRATEILDPDYRFMDEYNSEFGHIVMYFTIKRTVGLFRGQKITGRYGNKGVCGKVVPDYMMPHLANGEVVHVIFNTLGVYNRLNIFQLFEQSINFITNRVCEKFKNENLSLKEREKILFRVMEILNPEQEEKFHTKYKSMDKAGKQEFFDVIDKHGIQIHIKPFNHPVNLYEAIQDIYKEFPWIEPYDVYFYEPFSKRWVKMMRKQIVGELYVMKLKQSSKKQLSACSYAPIGRTGTPEKTDSAKKHKTLVSPTPIRRGIQEAINTMISIRPETYAKEHMYYRSSPVARREIGSEIVDNFGLDRPIEPKATDKMSARNVEILNAYMLLLGTEMDCKEDELYLPQITGDEFDPDEKFVHHLDGDVYIATPDYMLKEYARKKTIERMNNQEIGYIYIGEDGAYKEQVIDELALTLEAEILEEGVNFFHQEDEKLRIE